MYLLCLHIKRVKTRIQVGHFKIKLVSIFGWFVAGGGSHAN